jgi:cytochrome c biogenesis protein CcmG/thiol:disulfide interchange protein DsbE
MSETQALPIAAPRGNTRVVFGMAIVVTVAVIALFGFRLMQVNAPALASGAAPSFEFKTFDGQTIGLAALRGKPIVLNFWASWCQPCREEAPILQAVWEQYRTQNLMVVGVDYVDTEPEARKYMQEFKITYPNGPDIGTRVSQAYHITGVPETYFITRDGKLLSGVDASGRPYGNWIGPVPEAALRERVEKLLTQ